MVKKICFILGILLLILAAGSGRKASAAEPKVMVSDYSLSSDEIYAGDTFTVTVKLKNTSKASVTNMKCTISSEKGEFIPVDSTGSTYIPEIKAESEEIVKVEFSSSNSLQEKPYKLNINTEYENPNGKYESADSIYVPIRLKTDVVVSDTYIAEDEIRFGDSIEIVSTINNVGGTDIYKVTAKATGDNIADATCFVGNVSPGKSGNIDIITKVTSVKTVEKDDNKLTITYEDIHGNEYSHEELLGNNGVLKVLEQDYSDVIQVKEDTTKHITNRDKLLILLAIMVAIAVILVMRRRAKRHRLEREID